LRPSIGEALSFDALERERGAILVGEAERGTGVVAEIGHGNLAVRVVLSTVLTQTYIDLIGK
jgi:hypothetical protein